MQDKIYSNLNILLALSIVISFFIGFLFQENSSGGAIDFAHYYNNFKLFYGKNFFDVDWNKYESSSLPLYYFVTYFFYNPDNLIFLKIFNLLLSVSCLILYFYILKTNHNLKNSLAFLFASTLFLSPYFRTSTFWVMEENFPILMTFLALYFYFKLKINFNYYYLISAIFFSVCAFFSRQNYIIISISLFFLIYDFRNFFSKKNLIIIFFFIIFFSPSIYFIFIWNGLLPPLLAEQERTLIFNFYNIPHIMNILLIYIIPFIFFEKNKIYNYLFYKKKLIFLLFLTYILFFQNFIPSNFGGGAINKLLFIFFDGIILKYLSLIFSFFSIVFIYILFWNNKFIFYFFICNTFLLCMITPVWQEYLDPISLICILIFGNKLNKYHISNKFAYILVFYLSIFLCASYFDQNFINNI